MNEERTKSYYMNLVNGSFRLKIAQLKSKLITDRYCNLLDFSLIILNSLGKNICLGFKIKYMFRF